MVQRVIAQSEAAFLKARQLMPGGVSSPVRAFKAVGGNPLFIREGEGCTLIDLDGNQYIDYIGGYGPLIAGHANERVVAALSKAIGRGTTYGCCCEAEVELASVIVGALPAVQMVRFVNSGTEAVMSAVRLARAATGRDLIVKCLGGYHGHSDGLLAAAGSGALTLGIPSSPGVPASAAANTVLAAYNDLEGTKELFEKYGDRIAAFLVEPVAGNMGVVPPATGYLRLLRQLCDQYGALLIFDEVMTGFRVAWGGAQERFHVRPDLTCLGKVIGGGLPVGAYGGSKALMEQIAPSGPVYQAGTLSGNPLAMAGGVATLEILREPGAYETLEEAGRLLEEGLAHAAAEADVAVTIHRVGSMLSVFFTAAAGSQVQNLEQAQGCDTEAFAIFFNSMLQQGVCLAPSMFEAWFISLAHSPDIIERTVDAAERAMAQLSRRNPQ